jgi:hypothetical protein
LILSNFMRKVYYLNFYVSSIWYLNYLYLWIYNPLNLLRIKIVEVDMTWVEFLGKNLLKYVIQYFWIKFRYKIYIFIYLLINFLGWIYLLF